MVWSQRKPVVLSTGREYTRWKTELLLGRMTKKAPACVRRYAQALELHRQGHLAEAERIYAAILAARPDHVDSLHLLGMIKLAQGQPGEALRLIAGAMRGNGPRSGVFSEIGTADCGPVQSWLRIQPMKRMNGGKPSSTIDVRSPTTMIGKAA
jgi:hypothetical protein